MSSCFGSRKSRTGDREPLLPQYQDDTVLQRRLHQKLHSYQMLRALTKGFMPSNEQVIVNLRTLLASDVLNPVEADLSDSGRLLTKYTRDWLGQFIDLLRNKNDRDQIQDAIWFMTQSKLSIDTDDISRRASKMKSKADVKAAYSSFQTISSLLLTNSDFRLFLGDLQIVAREVFQDSAFKLSEVADKKAKEIGPSAEQEASLVDTRVDEGPTPSKKELGDEAVDVGQQVAEGAVEVSKEAGNSLQRHMSGQEKKTLIHRLQQAIGRLRQKPDYNDSVSTISQLIKNYAIAYSRAAEDTVEVAKEDVEPNAELEYAMKNTWSLTTSFGDQKEWQKLEQCVKDVYRHRKHNPDFEKQITEVGNSVEKLLTEPDFFNNVEQKFEELKSETGSLQSNSEIRRDMNKLVQQLQQTMISVSQDEDVAKLIKTSMKLANILSPAHALANKDLVYDCINIFIPLLIQAVQYIPIPRIEISVPEIDLLLENLIVEPGVTVNNTSFLPFRLRVETYNDLEVRKAKFRTVSKTTSLVTIKIDGISCRAEEIGFWLRAHSGILRLADEGIASFSLDDRGIDIHLDVELGEEQMEKVVSLKAVRVHIHKFSYQLRKSKFTCLAWLFKPLLRPIIRKVIEKQLANAIADFFHAANRELLYARERLRATRISDPKDLQTFVKAIITRLTPEEDPDLYSRVGVAQPGKGVFKGVYAPGSVVKLWNEEAARAPEVIDDFDRGGWRNEVFDTIVT